MNLSRFIPYILPVALMLGAAPAAQALDADYYASQSVLASGKWVKIRVDKAAIYEISYEQLEAWGFENPTQVTVWGYGGASLTENSFDPAIPDDLCQQFSYYHSGYRKLIFYGVGPVDVRLMTNSTMVVNRNVYSEYGYYFLTDSHALKPKSYLPYASDGRITLPYHSRVEFLENEFTNPAAGGTFWFDASLMEGEQTLRFPVTNFSSANRNFSANFIYRYASDARTSLTLRPTADDQIFTFNSSNFPTLVNNTGEPRSFILSTPAAMSLTANTEVTKPYWEVRFPAMVPTSTMTYAALDYAALVYNRTNQISTSPGGLIMMFPLTNTGGSLHNFSITGANSDTQIWSIDDPYDIRPFSTHLNNSTQVMTASLNSERSYSSSNGAARVITFTPSLTHETPEFAGHVTNQNLHGEEVPDMVIVTAPNLLTQAEALAQAHRTYQGLTVRVLTQEEIFNEFSSGTPSAMAIRRYAKMLYDRDPQRFRSLLLFGLGSWDNRHILIPDDNHVITYQCEDPYHASLSESCYSADAYFGMMDDATNTANLINAEMHVNVGRMPVNNTSDANTVVTKITDYLANPPIYGSYNRALLFCDDGDSNDHLKQSDSIATIVNTLNPAGTVTKVYNALYPWTDGHQATMLRQAIKYHLSQGQGYLGYAGHGRNDRLGYDQVLMNLSDIDGNDYSITPFTMLSTCDSYSFDRAANDIAGHLIRKAGGGAINVIGACRSVYKNLNQTFNVHVATEYFGAREGDLTGDVFRRARNNACTHGSEKLAVNTLCYNLAGDPAIPLYSPACGVATTKIGSVTLPDDPSGTEVASYPLVPFVIEGHITAPDGTVDTGFNGTIAIDIYDGSSDVQSSVKGEISDTHTKLVHLDETLLASKNAAVTGGYFSATVIVPAPSQPEGPNRISYYASTSDLSRFANGVCTALNVQTYDAGRITDPDTQAPRITALYIDDVTFVSGDETGPEINVFATIAADPSGINVSGGRIGTGTKLVVDGSKVYNPGSSSMTTGLDGQVSFRYGLSGLEDGYHTVELSLADNAGNRSSRTIGFVVINRSASARLYVAQTPARTEATLTLDHSFSGQPAGRLVIEDAQGRTVRTVTDCTFPYTWDLRDADAQLVPDGRYSAFVTLRSGRQYGNTDRIPVIVLK